MAILPFVAAAAAGLLVHAEAYGLAAFCALSSVTFAVAHGADLIAETLEEIGYGPPEEPKKGAPCERPVPPGPIVSQPRWPHRG